MTYSRQGRALRGNGVRNEPAAQDHDEQGQQGRNGHDRHHWHRRMRRKQTHAHRRQRPDGHLDGAHQRRGTAGIFGEGSQRKRRGVGAGEAQATQEKKQKRNGTAQSKPALQRSGQENQPNNLLTDQGRQHDGLTRIPSQRQAV